MSFILHTFPKNISKYFLPLPHHCCSWLGDYALDGTPVVVLNDEDYPIEKLIFETYFRELEPGELLLTKCSTLNCLNPLHKAVEKSQNSLYSRLPWYLKLNIYVQKDQCWLWNGIYIKQLPIISLAGLNLQAHRYLYEYVHNLDLGGKQLLKQCDTATCVNPAHYYPAKGISYELREATWYSIRESLKESRATDDIDTKLHCHEKIHRLRQALKGGGYASQ